MERRTTREVVRELCGEGARWESAVLVVAIGQRTALVHSADPDPLARLNHLMRLGGRPVGIVGYRTVEGETIWSVRPLAGCTGEPWVGYLEAVAAAEAA